MQLLGERYAVETGKRVATKLYWDSVPDVDFYLLYKRKTTEDDWQSISTFSFDNDEPVKVLNAYPSEWPSCDRISPGSGWYVHNASFIFADGRKASMSQSAALKVWLEGGKLNETDFVNYGENLKINNKQSIKVDLIEIEALNLAPHKIWDYDVVTFGSWDACGARRAFEQTCNFPTTNLVNELRRYIEHKYGVITSHDTLGLFTGNVYGLGPLREYFGVKVGGRNDTSAADFRASECDVDADGVPMIANWARASTKIGIVKYGSLVDYPWNLSGAVFDIQMSHTYGNLATSDVWLRFVPVPEFPAGNFRYNFPNSDPFAYLTTKNNTAMIQTGHSAGMSTDDERRVWANLVYHLKHRTRYNEVYDHSSVDEDPPEIPVCSCLRDYDDFADIQCNAHDSETTYMYRVEAYQDRLNGIECIGRSDDLQLDTASSFSHFVYLQTDTDTTETDTLLKTGTVNTNGDFRVPYDTENPYLNVVAVDQSGNIGPVLHYNLLDKCRVRTEWFAGRIREARATKFYLIFSFCYNMHHV